MHDYLNPQMNTPLRELSAQRLAYIGDAVFELMVRTYLCEKNAGGADKMHGQAKAFVSARSQASVCDAILPVLSEEELTIFKRGRNASSGSIPKSATNEEYHTATGFETLIGYLYLSGNRARLSQLFEIVIRGV